MLILDPGGGNCRSWQQRTKVWRRVTSPEQTATAKKADTLTGSTAFRALAKLANGNPLRVAAAGYLHDRAGMRVKFEATDATGKVHKRSSTSHAYSHCVVIHFAAHPPSKLWPKGVATHSHAEWVDSTALAERKANRWHKDPCVEAIEILEARQV